MTVILRIRKWVPGRLAALTVGFLMLWTSAVALCASYSAAALSGRVVDASTQLPMADVVVVAHWQLVGGFMEARPAGELKIYETTTDSEGRFTFPSWGPVQVLRPDVMLRNSDPELHLFKSGYAITNVGNQLRNDNYYRNTPVRTSDWDGRVVEMKLLDGDLKAAEKTLVLSAGELQSLFERGQDCEWKAMPLMASRLENEKRVLRQRGIRTPTFPEADHYSNQASCGSGVDWLKEHSK